MSRAFLFPETAPRTPVKKQRPSKARVYSNVEDVSWHSIAKDTCFPGIGNDYSSTFSLDPEEGQCTPVARWFRDRDSKVHEDPYDVSPPSFVQPGPPLVLKQDERIRLRHRFQARCDSPTPSQDTMVRLNTQDDTTASYASGATSLSATPDTTRSSSSDVAPRTRPKNPSPPPSTKAAVSRGSKARVMRPIGPSSYPSTIEPSTIEASTATRNGKTPKMCPDVPLASPNNAEVTTRRRNPTGRPERPSPRRPNRPLDKRTSDKDLELWEPGLPFIADFLSNERVLTRGGLRYHNRCPKDWYEG